MGNKKEQSIESKGIFTGLQVWLFFLIGFFLLGYPIPFSLGVGAIGGLAGGFIFIWWYSPDEGSSEEDSDELENRPKKRATSRIVEAQRKRMIREKTTPRGKAFSFPRLSLFSRKKR